MKLVSKRSDNLFDSRSCSSFLLRMTYLGQLPLFGRAELPSVSSGLLSSSMMLTGSELKMLVRSSRQEFAIIILIL